MLAVDSGVKVGHQPDTTQLVPSMESFRPTFLLAVPRVFEKVYNGAEQKAEAGGRGAIFRKAADVAIAHSKALDDGRVPLALRLQFALFDRLVLGKVRAALGGRAQYAVSGSAPLGLRLGHFYRSLGLTVLEGYGLTETTAPVTVNVPSDFKIGKVGPPLPGNSVRIADDGEIQVKGVCVFAGYWKNQSATTEAFDGEWFKTGDIGTLDEDGYLEVTGRKKEMIVTAGGKNVAPAALEDPIRANPIIGQVVVVGDRKPFISALVTLDDEMLPVWLENNALDKSMSMSEAAKHPKVVAEVQRAVDAANATVSRAESIRKFVILDADHDGAERTPHPEAQHQAKRDPAGLRRGHRGALRGNRDAAERASDVALGFCTQYHGAERIARMAAFFVCGSRPSMNRCPSRWSTSCCSAWASIPVPSSSTGRPSRSTPVTRAAG